MTTRTVDPQQQRRHLSLVTADRSMPRLERAQLECSPEVIANARRILARVPALEAWHAGKAWWMDARRPTLLP